MKRHLTLCLYFWIVGMPLMAQPINLSLNRGPFTFGHTLIPAKDGNWLVGGSAGFIMGYPAIDPYIALVRADGEILWEHFLNDIPYSELGTVTDMAYDPVLQVYYATGYLSGCDYGLPGFLYQFSSDGQVNWYLETPFYFSTHNLALQAGEGVVIAGEYPMLLQYYDASGNLLQEADLADAYNLLPLDLAGMGNNTTAVLGEEQLLLLNWGAGGWAVTAEMAVGGGQALSFIPEDTTLIVLGETKAYKLSASLEVIAEADISSFGEYPLLACSDSHCYALGSKPDEPFLALSFDAGLNTFQSFAFDGAYNHPSGMSTRNGVLFVTGNAVPDSQDSFFPGGLSGFYRYRGSDLFLQSWQADGTPTTSGMDVEVLNASFGDLQASLMEGGCDFSSDQHMNIQASNIRVRLRNNSSVTLNRLQLNAGLFPCSFICSTIQTFNRTYSNLNLAPGATVILDFPDIQTFPLPYSNPFELCIWASGPNEKLDDHFEDNEACLTFVISSTEEVRAALAGLTLFPNPAPETLNIQFGAELTQDARLSITNTLGQEVMNRAVNKGERELQLGIGYLPAGAYVLVVKAGEESVARRFVKR